MSKKRDLDNEIFKLLEFALNNKADDDDFHWEFVVLACLITKKNGNIPVSIQKKIRDVDGNLKFKGTDALNWFFNATTVQNN